LALLASPALLAMTTNVDIIDYAFSPVSVGINVNDSVNWIWAGNLHSSSSSIGLWDSGLYNAPHSYQYTFTSAGTYSYYCSYHYFNGSVTVQSVAVPPTVQVTNPPNGEVLSAPANLTLSTTASATGATVTNVGFFRSGSLLGNVTSSPYSWHVNGLAAGDYTLSAVASDSNGLSATNSVTVHVVTPAPLSLSGLRRTNSISFQFSYGATPGLRYVAQRSRDLQNWSGINTNVAAGSLVLFQDATASNSAGFYRVMRLPNPP
jgi:plastocyanin